MSLPLFSFMFQAVQSLLKQLCIVVTTTETTLIQNFSVLLVNLIQNNVKLEEQTFTCIKHWIVQVLHSAPPVTHNNILLALKNILLNEQFNDMDQVSIFGFKIIFYIVL